MKGARALERVSAIGVDVDTTEARAVQLASSGGGWRVRAAAVMPRADDASGAVLDDQEFRTLASVLERRGFTGRSLSLGAPSTMCTFHILDLPPSGSGAPIDAIARAEVARGLDGGEGLKVVSWGHHQSFRERVRFAVATDGDAVDTIAGSCERAGFELVRFVPVEMALFRAMSGSDRDEADQIDAVLSIGWDSSVMTLATGRTPVYSRRIPQGVSSCGDSSLLRALRIGDVRGRCLSAHAALVPLIDSIAEQLDTSLSYISQTYRREPFGSIWCSGYLSDDGGVLKMLGDRVGLPARPVCVMERLAHESASDGVEFYERRISPRFNTAVGLAMGDAA